MTGIILVMLFFNLALTLSLCVFAMNTCATVKRLQRKMEQQDDCINDLLEINLTNRGL